MRFVVVYNLCSGNALPPNELRRAFKRAGHSVEAMFDITHGLGILTPYLNQQDIAIAGYGGDGTMVSIAEKLIGSNAIFSPLPGGTLNHFTKDLGIAQDLDIALASLHNSPIKRIDIASVNDRVFLNNSSIGLYPSSLQLRDEMQRKNTNKWIAAIIASFKSFIRYQSFYVDINGERFKTPFVFIGNNDYKLENRFIGSRKTLDAGILSVYSVAASSRWSLFVILLRAIIGKVKAIDEVKIWKTDTTTIRTSQKFVRISRDGEHERVETPLVYRIHPKSLTVIGSS